MSGTSAGIGWWCATGTPSRARSRRGGAIEVRAPRVDDRRTGPETGQQVRFCSAILPPWCRNSPKVAELLAPVSRCRRSGKRRNVSVIFRPTGPKYRESQVGHHRIA